MQSSLMHKSRGDTTYLAWRIVGGCGREESLKVSASGCFCTRRRGGPSAIWVLAVIEIWRAVRNGKFPHLAWAVSTEHQKWALGALRRVSWFGFNWIASPADLSCVVNHLTTSYKTPKIPIRSHYRHSLSPHAILTWAATFEALSN
jgi:hypothetical protein